MGLDASVRCRCFEEGMLRPAPVPIEDLYIDEEGYLSSKVLDAAHEKYGFREMPKRYEELADEFWRWADHPCKHESGEECSEPVGNWSGVAMFGYWCSKIGEDKLPILSHILPDANGGIFSAEMAPAALFELDYFDTELDRMMEANPATAVFNVEDGNEVCSSEGLGDEDRWPGRDLTLFLEDGRMQILRWGVKKPVLSTTHFSCEPLDYSTFKDKPACRLTCLESGSSLECPWGINFCCGGTLEYEVRTRKGWCGTHANVALRKLLEASIRTGNPIRWC